MSAGGSLVGVWSLDVDLLLTLSYLQEIIKLTFQISSGAWYLKMPKYDFLINSKTHTQIKTRIKATRIWKSVFQIFLLALCIKKTCRMEYFCIHLLKNVDTLMFFIYLKTCFQITSDYIPIYNRFRSWAFHTFVEKGLGRLHIYIYGYAQSRITWQHIIETETTWKDGKGAHVLNKSTLLHVIVLDFWLINMMEKLLILLLKVKIQNVGLKELEN